MAHTVRAVDLFCGAGGSSSGLASACAAAGRRLDLTAVNHWQLAIETHALNHPQARHLCEPVDAIEPRKAISGKVDLLWASPECTHHSTARGGKPCSDQSRASAWCVLRWVADLLPAAVLIENVPEFVSWGPLGANNKPIVSKKGQTFAAFLLALGSLGYRTDWKILNAADYGDPTTRKRLFIQAQRGRRAIVWPEPTHAPEATATLFGDLRPWVAARDVIDWTNKGTSIFSRKRPLAPNTLARIAAGLKKFGGAAAEPFLVLLNGGGRQGAGGAQSIDRPVPAITAGGNHIGVCEPFLVAYHNDKNPGDGARRTHGLERPVPTLDTSNRFGLVEPFILPPEGVYRGNAPRSLDTPLQTITAGRGGGYLVEPFIVPQFGEGAPRSVGRPLGTITTTSRGIGLVEPYMIHTTHQGDRPAHGISAPLPTVTGAHRGELALIEPFLVKYNRTGGAQPLGEPIDTISTRDRFGLVEPAQLDILFRMLTPRELARAMSFPDSYQFAGNREQTVKQIGNAVPRLLAQRLTEAVLFPAA